MKLITFNAESLPKTIGAGNKTARVSFGKAGTIHFNGPATTRMELKPGDKITLAQDEEHPENWYFFLDPQGYELRGSSDKKGCLFNHAVLCDTLRDAVGLKKNTTNGFLIAGEPTIVKGDKNKTKYWGILIVPQS